MNAGVRVGAGTQFVYDGEVVEVVELVATQAGNEALLRDQNNRVLRVTLRELMQSQRARVLVPDPDAAEEPYELASVALGQLLPADRAEVLQRAAHVRETVTGYRSGSAELAAAGEPRPGFEPSAPLMSRYATKAAELGCTVRTIKRWVHDFREQGEAGLIQAPRQRVPLGRTDPRWVETALEIMAEHTEQSQPTQSIIIRRIEARLTLRYGQGEVPIPSQSAAYRALAELDRWKPAFRGSAARRRDIAGRPATAYGKLRPTRPGEYMLLDTTRSDVFAMDPVTLRWVQAEITCCMDWYSRCITGLRVTGVSTKSVDASSSLFQTYRPRPAPKNWPVHALWPEHGIPRAVLLDRDAIEGPVVAASGPALVPETVVIDHGKIYVSEHLTSVCQRLGISVQPARLRTGRDKGPLERFFKTLRQGLLEALPGYKGPDVHSRGSHPEADAFLFLDDLETIIREWIGTVYHHKPHRGLVDPGIPGVKWSPAKMFEHGMARGGYIEVPRDPDLAFEFLKVHFLPVHHYGVEISGRRYNGEALNDYRNRTSPYTGPAKGRWPVHVDSDDITRIYFRDPETKRWSALRWEHSPEVVMPLSEEALDLARRLAADKYTYPDDKLAVAELLARWNLGLGLNRTERRIALRLSREHAAIELPNLTSGDTSSLQPDLDSAALADSGDDDDDQELDLFAPDRAAQDLGMWEDV